MSVCGVCCQGEKDSEIAPVETKPAGGVGFSALGKALGKAQGGPGSMRVGEAVADAKRREEELQQPAAAVEAVPEPAPVHEQTVNALAKLRPSEVFNVEIAKGDRPMSIDINFHDHQTLLVTKVNPGPVEDFNRSNPSMEVAAGDRIEAVNGVERDTQAMLDACKTASTLKLRVRRCEEKTISLRSGNRSCNHGLSCQVVDGMTLIVTKIDANPEHDIQVEDRIIGVNGVRSNAAKVEAALDSAQSWDLIVRRIWPDDGKE